MAKRNPLRDDDNPQEFIEGKNISAARDEQYKKVTLPNGTTVDVLVKGHRSVRNANGEWVDMDYEGVNFDQAGNPIPSELEKCSISYSGYFTPPDKLAVCNSFFHQFSGRPRHIYSGVDGTATSEGQGTCSFCQTWKTTMILCLILLLVGVIIGIYRGAGFFKKEVTMDKDKNLKSLLVKIKELKDGRMDNHLGVKHHMDRAIATGDVGPFFRFLEKNPEIEKTAKRNRKLAQYQKEINPFRPYPDPQTARERLSGPLKLGYINEFDDMLGISYDILCLLVFVIGRMGTGKTRLIKYMLCQILKKTVPSTS
jgi:hypothetical protein